MRARWSRPVLLTVAAGLMLLFLGAGWMLWQQSMSRPGAVRQELVSTFDGSHSAASHSPDGSFIAFLQEVDGVAEVFVKNLVRGDPVQVTRGGTRAERPRWSPKNDQIVFARTGLGIWSAPPLGGEARRILEQAVNPNFSADGSLLVFERQREIWMAAADGTSARQIEGVPIRPLTDIYTKPALSPDGRTVAFFLQEAGPNGDLWTIPSSGGTPTRLTSDGREGGDPVWTRDGRAIVFWSTRSGSATLWRIAADGGSLEPLTTGAGTDREPDFTADGRRLMFTNVRQEWVLTISSRTNPVRTVLTRRTPIWLPHVSPDGQSIATFQDIGPDIQLFVQSLTDNRSRQVTFGSGDWNIHPTWSPDGNFLYFLSRASRATLVPPRPRRWWRKRGDRARLALADRKRRGHRSLRHAGRVRAAEARSTGSDDHSRDRDGP